MVKIKKNILEAGNTATASASASWVFYTKEYIITFFRVMKETKSSALDGGSKGGHTGQGAMTYDQGKGDKKSEYAIISNLNVALTYEPSTNDLQALPKTEQGRIDAALDLEGIKGFVRNRESVNNELKKITTYRLPRFPHNIKDPDARYQYLTGIPGFVEKYKVILPYIENYYCVNDKASLPEDKDAFNKYLSFKRTIENMYSKHTSTGEIPFPLDIVNSPFISSKKVINPEDVTDESFDDGVDRRLELAHIIDLYEQGNFEAMATYRGEDFATNVDTLSTKASKGKRLKQDVNTLGSVIDNNDVSNTEFTKLLIKGGLPANEANTITHNSDTSKECTFDDQHLIVQFLGSDDMSTRNDKLIINGTSQTMNRIYYFAKLDKDATVSTNLDGRSVLLFAVGRSDENKFSPGKVYNNILDKSLLGRLMGTNTPINVDPHTNLGTVMTKEVKTNRYKLNHCVQLPGEILRVLNYGVTDAVNIRALNPISKSIDDKKPNPVVEGLYRFEVKPNI